MDRWSISVPGVPSMVPVARLFVRAFLTGHPLAGDAELITSEYAANALRHTTAGEGGVIQITVSARAGLVRIEVTDHPPPERGLPAAPPTRQPPGQQAQVRRPRVGRAGEDDESGRGLLLVDALASRWGHEGVAGGRRTAWAELSLPAREPATGASGTPPPR